ncbi:MAG TPA: hypothetical protein VGG16_04725 [Streptosporangiaceae bacterium]
MEEYSEMIMASRENALWDLRDVPLARINEYAEAKQLVDVVMASAGGESLIVVAGFNSAI